MIFFKGVLKITLVNKAFSYNLLLLPEEKEKSGTSLTYTQKLCTQFWKHNLRLLNCFHSNRNCKSHFLQNSEHKSHNLAHWPSKRHSPFTSWFHSLLNCSNLIGKNTSITCQTIKEAPGDLCCVGGKMEQQGEQTGRRRNISNETFNLGLNNVAVLTRSL